MRTMTRASVAALATMSTVCLVLAGCSSPPPAGPSSTTVSAAAPATTTTTSTPPGPPTIRGYDFPGGMIEGAQGGGKLYTRVGGVVALPAGTGRHPVVVVVHGSYPSCIDLGKDNLLTSEVATTPWPEGCGTARKSQEDGLTAGPDYVRSPASLAYLAAELAQRGFAVLIPDVNSKERLDWGGEPQPATLQTNLVKLHLDLAKRLDGGDAAGLSWGGELKGRLDTSQIALVGHSSGAGYVIDAAYSATLPGIKASVGIEPAMKSSPKATGVVPPVLALIGECDEQIPAADVAKEVADIAAANPTSPLVSATLGNATHIATLTGGGSHKIGMVIANSSPACKDDALLDKALQRAATAQVTADFIEGAFKGTTAFTLRTVGKAPLTAKAMTGAVTVSTAAASTSPVPVDPKSVVYTASTVALLPAKPADLKLSGGAGARDV